MRSGKLSILCILLFQTMLIFAQDLNIGGGDVWVSQGADGGYHLYIRKKHDVASVLLVETTRDPSFREPNYAYRTNVWNPVNGDELRIIDGHPLPQHNSWSLIDSTPEFVPELGIDAFHVYIPFFIQFGYPYTRNGEVYVVNGTYFNIRAFTLPHADYQGVFKDNPFVLEITQDPLPGPPDLNYMKDTEDSFDRLSRLTGGRVFRSRGPEDIVETLGAIFQKEAGHDIDVVLCIDTTASMRNDITALRMRLVAAAQGMLSNFLSLRVGVVAFRDYKDAYITRVYPFTADLGVFQKTLSALQAVGGGDIPEAVHEGLYESITKYQWRPEARKLVILIGDAPPHLEPRGKITEIMVIDAARDRDVQINSVLLPQ
ncbi:MAG: VWA domain-containing protein [Spirochaetaceae bacterium]|jgi:hypothetical protein|nr:VWA domain-containing protein [Spirochaetaceae bacterium]